MLFGVVAYNLYGVLVRAYSTVRAETVEFTAGRAFGSGVEFFGEVQGRVGYVFVNTYSEVILGFFRLKVFINGKYHRGGELFRAQAVSSAVNLYLG